jgi:hypothetical protein
MRYPKRLSQRAVRNHMAGLKALVTGEPPTFEASTPRGPQPEGETNKAIAQWRRLKPGLVLERNKRRLAIPVGGKDPMMLGWDLPGSADWIGYRSVVITPGMVGQRIAQFVAVEAKRPDGPKGRGGVVSDDQEKFLNGVKDAGGVAIVARSAQDAEEGYK